MKLKKAIALFTAVISIFSLAACGNSGKTNSETDTANSGYDWTAGADASGGEVTLRVATWRKYDKDYYEEIIKRFEEKYDWITVKLEINADSGSYYSNLNADLISGVAPDVFDCHPGSTFIQYAEEGMVAPQTDFDYMKNYSEEAKRVTTLWDDNYGYMNAYNFFGILYNKDVFAKHGVEVPATPDELVAAVNTFKSAGYGGVAYAGGTDGYTKLANMVSVVSLGAEGYSNFELGLDDGSITDISTVENMTEALKTLELYTQNEVWYNSYESISYEAALSLFAMGKTPMFVGGSYLLGEAVHFEDMNVGYFPVPTYVANGNSYAEGAQTTLINAAGKNLGAAKLWVEHLATAEISEYYCTNASMMSTINGVAPETDILTMLQNSCEGYSMLSLVEPENKEYWAGGLDDLMEGIIFEGKHWEDLVKTYSRKLIDYDLGSL